MNLYSYSRRKVLDSINFFHLGTEGKIGTNKRQAFAETKDLVQSHFHISSVQDHPCRETLHLALEHLQRKPAVIVETGSSAWGTNSSLLFDSYVNSFGGVFESVDIRAEPMRTLKKLCSSRSTFFCDDSVVFLKKYSDRTKKIDLVYLDSWDVDWRDPMPSALHGFHEFITIFPLLKRSGGLLLIDDTPVDSGVMEKVQEKHVKDYNNFHAQYGFSAGKGSLVKKFLEDNKFGRLLAHDYQVLWKFG